MEQNSRTEQEKKSRIHTPTKTYLAAGQPLYFDSSVGFLPCRRPPPDFSIIFSLSSPSALPTFRFMEKYFARTKRASTTPTTSEPSPLLIGSSSTPIVPLSEDIICDSSFKRAKISNNPLCEGNIVIDPGLHKDINEHESRIIDDVRREYMQTGPCQPFTHLYGEQLKNN